ncbi:CBS domain-containing protein [Methanococcus voltae]|uniref:Putative signal transduction protein with CBS domains n=1 Tax=Methanococcus voltae (strain ATCC BAA-1334 / A3) TaxID=456320 RepID=D7DV75_METV3|nr:CBS domain-containing protein [Methanococcus voltae]MCS3901922.1 putative transcriptional regulator [Methanococcus voltae]
MDLTIVQKEILQELILIYKQKNKAVKGTEIAKNLSRNPGTIRNQMQALRALGLVDGVPGPKGGYIPTSDTYRSLGLELDEKIKIPIYKGDKKIKNVNVTQIIFDTVTQEKSCSSKIYINGDTKQFSEGDLVRVGPTLHNKIVIMGNIVGRDDINHILLIDVLGVISVPNIDVGSISLKENLIIMDSGKTVRDAAKLLAENSISGIPIIKNGKLKGIVSLHDIAKALVQNKENEKIDAIMTKDIWTINQYEKIYDALVKMETENIGRLVVVDDSENIVGMLTRTDILNLIEGTIYPKLIEF